MCEKKIERDKREETMGYKKIIKISCTRENIHDIICARYVPVKKYPGTELVIKKLKYLIKAAVEH